MRIGNGAFDQHQHDVWGMLLDAVATHVRHGGQLGPEGGTALAGLVDVAIERHSEPDQGIWEMRGDPQHFVASKVMCWVAVDRGVQLAQCARRRRPRRAMAGRRRRRSAARSSRRASSDRGVFKQHYDTEELDASLLLIPIMGFLPPDDDRVRATVLADRRRAHEGRSRPALPASTTTDDGLSGEEGTFTICSFWLVTALAMIGETDARPGAVREAPLVRGAAAACTPRRSTRPPASTWATSPRRSPTSR